MAGREAIIDARRFFNFYRLTRDGRLIFGGGRALYRADRRDRGAGQTVAADPAAWRRLVCEFRALSPVLAEVSVAKAWSGVMGFTLTASPSPDPFGPRLACLRPPVVPATGSPWPPRVGAKVADAILDGGIKDLAPWAEAAPHSFPPTRCARGGFPSIWRHWTPLTTGRSPDDTPLSQRRLDQRLPRRSQQQPRLSRGRRHMDRGAIAMVVEPAPELGLPEGFAVWLDLDQGQCQGARAATVDEAREAPFCLTPRYDRWRAVIERRLDPVAAMITRRIALDGDLMTMIRYARSAQAMVYCATAPAASWRRPSGVA